MSVAPNDTKPDFLLCCSSSTDEDNLTRPPKTLRGSHAVDGLCRHFPTSCWALPAETPPAPSQPCRGRHTRGGGGWHRAHNPLCPPPFPPARGAQGAGHSTAESCCVQPRAPQHRNDLTEGPAEGHKGDQGSGAL